MTQRLAADVRIRPATEADVPALGRLGASLMRLHYDFDRQRFLAPRDNPEEGYGYFLGSQLRDAAGFIHDVVVDESHRGGGIASALLETASLWLKAHGAPRVMLWTAERNHAAQRLFEQAGFRRTMIEMTREL